jgi:two-component system chemotaxis response regulator CheB
MANILASEVDIEVTGSASDGKKALSILKNASNEVRAQVVILDLEMPVMDGMTALPKIVELPGQAPAVIVASSLTQRGATAAMAALRAGAVDYIPKPSASHGGVEDPAFRTELLAKIRGWARVRRNAQVMEACKPRLTVAKSPLAIGIGCSTGGPQALAALLRRLPKSIGVPILVVQHMPPGFTSMLADHLDRLGGLPAAEARAGEVLHPDRIYVAPGDRHLLVESSSLGLRAVIGDGPPEHFCRPAVDPMLRGLTAACGGRVLAVILTGMGSDGLSGCLAVHAAGGSVLAQDEASSVVWGMPGAVVKAGIVKRQGRPEELALDLLSALGIKREGVA